MSIASKTFNNGGKACSDTGTKHSMGSKCAKIAIVCGISSHSAGAMFSLLLPATSMAVAAVIDAIATNPFLSACDAIGWVVLTYWHM